MSPGKRIELLSSVATQAVSEAAKEAVKVVVSSAVPGVPLAAAFASIATKDLLDALLKRTSSIEKKIDALLREPLQTGLRLLREAVAHPISSDEEIKSRDALLDAAHVSFHRARALVEDSREDSTFIRALDCLALVGRSGRMAIALQSLGELQRDIHFLRERVQALKASAEEWTKDLEAMRKYFGREKHDFSSKPFGYETQLIWVKGQEKQGAKVKLETQAAQMRLAVLENIAALTESAAKKPATE